MSVRTSTGVELRPDTISVGATRSGERLLWRDAAHALLRHRSARIGLLIIGVAMLAALTADLVAPYDPTLQVYDAVLSPPSAEHLLGTDNLGRDSFSRLLYGARTSLSVGIFAQFILVMIGVPLGATAALLGGRADSLLMRVVDVFYAFPELLLIMLLRSVFGGSIWMIFLAIGLVDWTTLARLTRGQVLQLRQQDYVLAAHALGARPTTILFRHLLPNALGPLLVAVVFGIPRAIFAEAALSYIGVGVQPPTPSWGTMVNDGYQAMLSFPHLILFPCLAIAALTLAFNFVGDGLRDALDPRRTYGGGASL